MTSTHTAYVALLRGINVGGNNVIRMSDLRLALEGAGFTDVRSFIASGNVLFRAKQRDSRRVEAVLEALLSKRFRYKATVIVRSLAEYAKMMKAMPKGWDADADWRHYVLFLHNTVDSKKVLGQLGTKPEIETVRYVPGAVLWSAEIAALTRSGMHKMLSTPLYKLVTIRNANTTKKIFTLLQDYV